MVEVLLHCSKDSVKDAATEAARPVAAGETGEMQVREEKRRMISDLCSNTIVPAEVQRAAVVMHVHYSNALLSTTVQVVPVMLHLLTSISSVRLYIPKDLRPFDNRQLMLKSIQVRKKTLVYISGLSVQCTDFNYYLDIKGTVTHEWS